MNHHGVCEVRAEAKQQLELGDQKKVQRYLLLIGDKSTDPATKGIVVAPALRWHLAIPSAKVNKPASSQLGPVTSLSFTTQHYPHSSPPESPVVGVTFAHHGWSEPSNVCALLLPSELPPNALSSPPPPHPRSRCDAMQCDSRSPGPTTASPPPPNDANTDLPFLPPVPMWSSSWV